MKIRCKGVNKTTCPGVLVRLKRHQPDLEEEELPVQVVVSALQKAGVRAVVWEGNPPLNEAMRLLREIQQHKELPDYLDAKIQAFTRKYHKEVV